MVLNHFSLSSQNSEVVDFSELGTLSIALENVGTESSGLVYASVTPQTDNVNILTSPILTDSVAAGGIAEVGPFEFNVSINSLNQDEILLNLVLVDDINSWQYPISFRVNAPDYNMVSSSILDGGNNALDPGENVTLRMVIENSGNAPLNYPTFDMFENDNYILVEELNADNAYFWEVGSSVVLSAVVSISEDAPVGHTAIAWIDIGSLNTSYESMISIPLNIGMLMDNFETEDFSSHDWSFAGQGEWFIQSEQVFDGNYAARSGAVSNNQSSELLVDYNVLNQGYIRFNAKVSSEQGSSGTPYDYLNFYIDNEELVLVGGDSDWAEYSYLVSPGQHTFKWVYEKDNAGLSGDDCAWIDNVIFPPGSIPPLNIDFGDLNQDENINVLDVILTVSSVLGYGVLSEEQKIAADINMDGLVNIVDVTLIIDMLFAN
jgi:hypothetical protein